MVNAKFVPTAWVEKHVISAISKLAVEPLPEVLALWRKKCSAVRTIAASSLHVSDSLKMFNISLESTRFDAVDIPQFGVPDELTLMYKKMETVLASVGESNEAFARCFINNIVICSILDERVFQEKAAVDPRSITPTKPSTYTLTPHPPASPASTPTLMRLFVETELKEEILYDNEQVVVSGLADYSLGCQRSDCCAGNLVIVEAKRRYFSEQAYGQLIAYMAIVHDARKAEDKENKIVYGVATDGVIYTFWMLDNGGNLTQSSPYDWQSRQGPALIYSMFRSIVRTAMLTTLTTSPVKNDAISGLLQTSKPSTIDFDTGANWENIFVDELPPGAELIETSEDETTGDS